MRVRWLTVMMFITLKGALTTRTRTEHTDIHHGHPMPIRTHAHLRLQYTADPAVQGSISGEKSWGAVWASS